MMPWIELPTVFLLRALQAAVLSLPTLLAGMLVAGALITFVGESRVQRWFSSGRYRDWMWAALFAIALPVCSIGMLPVAATLRAMRVRWGSIVIVVLVGPVVTPYTLGYLVDRVGLEALGWLIVSSVAGSFATAWVVERVAKSVPPLPDDRELGSGHSSALIAFLSNAGTSLTAGVAIATTVGCLGVGAVAVAIPPNAVGDWLVDRSLQHAALLALVPWFTYITPTTSAMQAGEIVESSTMPGLLVPMIALGAAMHLGVLMAAFRRIGPRAAAAGLLVAALSSVVFGIAVDARMHDPSFETGDSHAFEDYGRPYHLLDHPDGPLFGFLHRFSRPLSGGELWAGAGIIVICTASRFPRSNTETSLSPQHLASPLQLRAATALILAGSGVHAVYSAVPAPNMIVAESRRLSAELVDAVRQGQLTSAERSRRLLDRRLSQIRLSAALRGASIGPKQAGEIEEIRSDLSLLFASNATATTSPAGDGSIAFVAKLNDALRRIDRGLDR
jgi:uncharacterized membrane protein YraQ (UPF0718 family)